MECCSSFQSLLSSGDIHDKDCRIWTTEASDGLTDTDREWQMEWTDMYLMDNQRSYFIPKVPKLNPTYILYYLLKY
ncbi:unnamed protein product [Caretta caretta]